jgi:hypothetical protein
MNTIQGKNSWPFRILCLLNRRVIKPSYTKSTIYFTLAIAICLLFYYWMSRMSSMMP